MIKNKTRKDVAMIASLTFVARVLAVRFLNGPNKRLYYSVRYVTSNFKTPAI
jgi:hypothetical protein